MSKHIYTVTSKTGKVYTRSSARVYTHAVVVPARSGDDQEGILGYASKYTLAVSLTKKWVLTYPDAYIVEVGTTTLSDLTSKYDAIIQEAVYYMDSGCEPTSALKQAASDNGIPYGLEMQKFVSYANSKLYK